MNNSNFVQVNINGVITPNNRPDVRLVEVCEAGHYNGFFKIIIGAEAGDFISAIKEGKKFREETSVCGAMIGTFKTFNIRLVEVSIFLTNGTQASAKIVLRQEVENAELKEIEVRVSDALALAMRYSCPIFVERKMLEKIFHQQNSDEPIKADAREMTLGELEKEMKRAVKLENYEKAALIRDEITRRTELIEN
ncbi:MAG: DUF151 domain-containing protein [Prevotellaceae bacterium]|jgi:bifunctional DNase/RNase|nr:DUF151 domain-containing protein [Prevotellaceae bacterium]